MSMSSRRCCMICMVSGKWKTETELCGWKGYFSRGKKKNIYHKVSCHIGDLTGLRGLASFNTSRRSCQETTGSTFNLCSLKKCSTEMTSFIAVNKISIGSSHWHCHKIVVLWGESATKALIWLGRNSKIAKVSKLAFKDL